MVLKTRDKLIEVARQLFARKGVENTTMFDIAEASDKGRRTLYTYFKNKREIHQAVIERESEQIITRQRQILESDGSAVDKLRQFLEARFQILTCPAIAHAEEHDKFPITIRIDMKRAEKTRRLAAQKEVDILQQILDKGVEDGEFTPAQAARTVSVLLVMMQGVDSPTLPEHLEDAHTNRHKVQRDITEFVINGIIAR